MKTAESFPINITFLENRICELDLKQWWVAENIGVDRKTLARWLSGKVKNIKRDNLLALAHTLECEIDDLILKSDTLVVSSRAEQSEAAKRIVEDKLLEILTPSGDWPLLESIVKSTMEPGLSKHLLGKLYNYLSICSWRQDRLEKAFDYAMQALEIGEKINSPVVVYAARSNLGIIHHYRAELEKARGHYLECIDHDKYFESPKIKGSSLSNLAMLYCDLGEYKLSIETQKKSIEVFETLGLPLNLSIAHCAMGLTLEQLGSWEQALAEFVLSGELATSCGYKRGVAAGLLYRCTSLYHLDLKVEALDYLGQGIAEYQKLNIEEALNYSFGMKIYGLEGNSEKFDELFVRARPLADDYPLERAGLFKIARIEYRKRGQNQKARDYALKEMEIYKEAGAVKRQRELEIWLSKY
ncbi:MAG: helix-turn-helix domain-containing protein [Bacteriovoracaceae bacterium]|jgi:tetratricopeptide (TPR) repeat protein|nr:helix-turn-helix domain-containing protein [Bacteriovoracaceae bacterium]